MTEQISNFLLHSYVISTHAMFSHICTEAQSYRCECVGDWCVSCVCSSFFFAPSDPLVSLDCVDSSTNFLLTLFLNLMPGYLNPE
eukprot:m.385501 g.385501  ORF g.385501 m.385501 type:complete len:85 (-) comp138183_c0_seq1:35-289(-)